MVPWLKNTDGAGIDSRVVIKGNHILDKRIMDAFSNPELGALLVENQIDQLFITGIAADQCVDRTTKAALNRNYKVTVISDAVGTVTDEKRDMKLKEFLNMGVSIISTDELLRNDEK
jgi:nicotinamidase-related amidase